MGSACGEKPVSVGQRLPYGLTSLLDMVDCSISALGALCSQLMLEEMVRHENFLAESSIDAPIDASDVERIKGWMKVTTA